MFHGWILGLLWGPLIFLMAPLATLAADSQREQLIRVHLDTTPRMQISGFGLKIAGQLQLKDHKRFAIRCDHGDQNKTVLIEELGKFESPLTIEAKDGFLFYNGNPYRRALRIIAQDGKCMVVNITALERYVAGVVAKEMHPSWPLEALKAQAVAARSYALANIRKPRNKYYDVLSSTMDQVFAGAVGEDTRTILAARLTRGKTLMVHNKVIKAYYHSHCGGKTELPRNVWGIKNAAYQSVSCPYHSSGQPQSVWHHELSKKSLEQKLHRLSTLLPQSFRNLANIRVSRNINSNRVATVMLADEKGSSLELEAGYFRKLIGNGQLKSTKFRVVNRNDSFEFEGTGFGHGVGLCQYGSREMALRGKSYTEILHQYYPLASLQNLY